MLHREQKLLFAHLAALLTSVRYTEYAYPEREFAQTLSFFLRNLASMSADCLVLLITSSIAL